MAGVPVVFSEVLNVSMKSGMRSSRDPTAISRGRCGEWDGQPWKHTRWPRRQEVAKAWRFDSPGRG